MCRSRLFAAALGAAGIFGIAATGSAAAGPCSDRLSLMGARIALETSSMKRLDDVLTPALLTAAGSSGAADKAPAEGRSAYSPTGLSALAQGPRVTDRVNASAGLAPSALAEFSRAQTLDAQGNSACSAALDHYEAMRKAS